MMENKIRSPTEWSEEMKNVLMEQLFPKGNTHQWLKPEGIERW